MRSGLSGGRLPDAIWAVGRCDGGCSRHTRSSKGRRNDLGPTTRMSTGTARRTWARARRARCPIGKAQHDAGEKSVHWVVWVACESVLAVGARRSTVGVFRAVTRGSEAAYI